MICTFVWATRQVGCLLLLDLLRERIVLVIVPSEEVMPTLIFIIAPEMHLLLIIVI